MLGPAVPLTAAEALGAEVAGAEAQDRELVQPGHHLLGEGQQPGQPLQLPVQPLPVPLGRIGAAAFGRPRPHPAGQSRVTGRLVSRPRSLPGTPPLSPPTPPLTPGAPASSACDPGTWPGRWAALSASPASRRRATRSLPAGRGRWNGDDPAPGEEGPGIGGGEMMGRGGSGGLRGVGGFEV